MALADAVAGRAGDDAFAEFEQAARGWMAAALAQGAARGARSMTPLADIWEAFGRNLAQLEAYNLDRKPFILGFFSDMAEAIDAAQCRRLASRQIGFSRMSGKETFYIPRRSPIPNGRPYRPRL